MGRWTFKALKTVKPEKTGGTARTELIPLSDGQKRRVRDYEEALKVALESRVSNPVFSNYSVRESVVIPGENILEPGKTSINGFKYNTKEYKSAGGASLPAGNIEYGFCQALHGEESAIAALRSKFNSRSGKSSDRKIILGIVAGIPGSIPSPCGNCRDIMLDELGNDFEIVSGAPEGGVAIVADIKDYLFDDFSEITKDFPVKQGSSSGLTGLIRSAFDQTRILTHDAYTPPDVIHRSRRYGAAIELLDGRRYFGALDLMADYHPIYPLRDAIRQARRDKDLGGDCGALQRVVIVSEENIDYPPHVMYKDRQHLTEFNFQLELLSGQKNDPEIFLVVNPEEDSGMEKRIWITTAKTWMPLPFTPENFGPDFIKFFKAYCLSKS